MNKKGQIAIEILVVLSILVIGGIFVGVYYIQGIGQNQQNSSTTNSTLDSLVDNFTDPFDIPDEPDVPLNKVAAPIAIPSEGEYPVGTPITLISQTDGAIIRYALNSSDVNESSPIFPNDFYLTEDVQISAIAYKTGMEPSSKVKFTYTVDTTSTLEFTNIKIDETAVPTGVVANAPFTLKVVAEATVPSVRVSRVIIQKNGMDTDACKFLGVGAMGKDITCIDGICTDLGYLTNPEIAGTSYSNNFKFSCSEPGTYSFIFTGVLKTDSAEYSHMTSSEAITIAPPIPNTIVAEIISPQDGLYYKDKPLILSSNIIGAEKEDLFCNWYATSKESQASLFLSDKCDSLYDLSSGDLELDKSYEINLFVSEKEGELSAAASPKIITIVDFADLEYLFFNPSSGQEMNEMFRMYFYASEIVDFRNGGYFEVTDVDDHCNFELLKSVPDQYEFVNPSNGNITNYFKYTFNSSCSVPGNKTITLQVFQPNLPAGKGEVQSVSSITSTYLIYDMVPSVDVEFGIYFRIGPKLPSMSEVFDEDLIVKGKESYRDEFYFAAPYTPNQTVFVDIYQGQKFYVYPSIISNPPQYLDGQGICTVKFTPLASNPLGKLQIYQQPCNHYKDYQITKLLGEYNLELSVTGPNGMSFSNTKLVRFNTNPIYFISDNVYPIYYTDYSFPIELAISNINNLPLNVSSKVYKLQDTSAATSYVSTITGTLRFTGGFDPMEGYFLINSPTYTCNSSNSICTNHYLFSDSGTYKVKIDANTDYGDQVTKWVNFEIVDEPDGAEISYEISKTPTNVNLTGLLYRIVGTSTYYKMGDVCVWNIDGQIKYGCNITHNFSSFGEKNISVVVYEQTGTPVSKNASTTIELVAPPVINSTMISDNNDLPILVGESIEFQAGNLYPITGGELKFVQAENCAHNWYVEGVPINNGGSCEFIHTFYQPGQFEISATINHSDGTPTEVITYATVSESQITDPVSYGAQCILYYDPGNPGNPNDACKIYEIDFQGGALLNTTGSDFRYNFVFRNSNNQIIHQTFGAYDPSPTAPVLLENGYKKIYMDAISLVVPLSTSINTGGNLPYTFWIENLDNQDDYTEQNGVLQCYVIPGCP